MAITTAAETKFCLAKIENGKEFLWIDGNQKITAGNGTYEEPKPNAFSIVQVKDCPFSTNICQSTCYVHNLEKFANETHKKYQHNSAMIHKIVENFGEWPRVMGEWISQNATGGFRWHVSGDVFNEKYACFIVEVCNQSPNVKHWIYTRSYPYVKELVKAKNLVVNLSADKDNYNFIVSVARKFNVRVCYMTTDGALPKDLMKGSVIFPDYSLRIKDGKLAEHTWWNGLSKDYKKMICPVDMFGKSENVRCGVCKKCLNGGLK